MRTIAFAMAALFLSALAAHADGTWCAHYGGRSGGTNCGFYFFQLCMAALSGNGGACMRNPFAAYGAEPRRHYRRVR